MKALRRLVIVFTLFMLAGLLVFVADSRNSAFEKRDIVHYNDLLHRVQSDMEAGVEETEIEDKYNCVIAMSKEINNPELASLYSNGAIILDLEVDGEYVGKVGWNDIVDDIDKTYGKFFKAALILWAAVFVCGYLLLLYLYLYFVRPTKELNDFAVTIAKGDFDKSLPIRKNNMFGSFVEGFDIMREQLKASISRERESEIARKELVQGLSHDIKTPLAVIEATCDVIELKETRKMEMLSGDRTNDEIVSDESLGIAVRECQDLIGKVKTISDKAETISRLMNDVMHANLEDLEKVDVVPCEEESIVVEGFFGKLSDYGRIVLENHIHPCLVYMDKKRMEQVIDNVISNSGKYAGTDINVSFSQTEEIPMADGSSAIFIKITIRDSGPGVDQDELPLIAEKYYRGSNSKNAVGYGLGLYLCKTYMDKQKGGMEYYNDNGFVVELLLRKV
ncbi:MAG: HAMP domain-containing histidine kinase [Lachnospiraceae bacterium]|nr:HAMP domain-containing histidine kinase [Lachnospiraceae bacterium]